MGRRDREEDEWDLGEGLEECMCCKRKERRCDHDSWGGGGGGGVGKVQCVHIAWYITVSDCKLVYHVHVC